MKLAIYNSTLRYDTFGFFIEYCRLHQYSLDIYTCTHDDRGWLQLYNFPVRKRDDFLSNSHIYDVVIVNCKDFPFSLYDLSQKTLLINYQPYGPDLNRAWIMTIQTLEYKKTFTVPTILVSIRDKIPTSDYFVIRYNPNITIQEKIKLLEKCSHVFYDSEDYSEMDEIVALAYSTNTRLVMSSKTFSMYGLKSAIVYDKPSNPIEISEEIDLFKDQFTSILYTNFPNLFKKDSSTKIPKKIHFIWLGPNGNTPVPAKYQKNIDQYKSLNPDFEIIVWNNTMIESLFEKYSIDYKFPYLISKCDVARFCVIYDQGGIYSDLDFYCRKNLCGLLQDKEIFFTREIPEHEQRMKRNLLSVSFFAAIPQHEFVWKWIQQIGVNFKKINLEKNEHVMNTTGPVAFYRFYNENTILLSDPCSVFPFDKEGNMSSICKDCDIYTYTLWNEGSGWEKNSWGWLWILFFIVIFLCLINAFGGRVGNYLGILGKRPATIS